jgi:H+-translocating NAD(P) transhydrogenase subunit beta
MACPSSDVEHAKDVPFVKRGLGAGYASVENELFFQIRPCFLDAKRMTDGIVKALG